MAEDEKHSWWKSLPGILTAATGFVAALSGLVAGLNQLGAFRREPSATPAVSTTPAPRESMEAASARADTTRALTGTQQQPRQPSPVATPRAGTPRPAGPAAPAAPAAAPSAAPASSTRTSPAADTIGHLSRLPTGTVLELVIPRRTCAPSGGQQRSIARLAEPVKVAGETVLRANTTVVLHLRRGESGTGPSIGLDSLVARDFTTPVSASTPRIRRGADGASCLRADARIRVVLGAPLTIPRR